MSVVAILPTRLTVDAAWLRYQALIQAATADPALFVDRAHCEAMIHAHAIFADLLIRSERTL